MLDRVPAPGKANRIRILQDDGTAVEGVLSYADEATQSGSTYTKGNVLPDTVCAMLGLESDAAQPRDAFRVLAVSANAGWVKLQEYTTAGSGQWEAPDLFGGEDYIIGVLVIGAGASGGAAAVVSSGNSFDAAASGGASGYARYFTMTVSPGQKIPYVIGQGGPAVTASGGPSPLERSAHTDGINGGSSSFAGISAAGGDGGDSSAANDDGSVHVAGAKGGQRSANASPNNVDGAWGGVLLDASGSEFTSDDIDGLTGYAPLECYDPFACRRILCSGGGAHAGNPAGTGGEDPISAVLDDVPSKGGDGAAQDTENDSGGTVRVTAEAAAGPGNGGGAAALAVGYDSVSNRPTAIATSGAGSDGAVYIYIQGRAVE